jgi:enolase
MAAGKLMSDAGLMQGVADEGGFWPAFNSNEQALDFLVRSIERAGFTPGQDVAISLDIAATDFGKSGRYRLSTDDRDVDSDGLSEMLLGWLKRYPIVAIQDPLGEDDFICTTQSKIKIAHSIGACNTALIKPNQAGTLTESKAALDEARAACWETMVLARSVETEDVKIVHFAVGWGVKQLKVGSFALSERMKKMGRRASRV